MKKVLNFSFFALVVIFSFAPHVFAATQTFTALAPIPGLTANTTSVIGANTLATFFNNLYKYLIGIAAILAVIEIIWGGLQISTQDSVSKQGEGRERITHAILGLVLVLSPVIVFTIINPSILNLSLNLPGLNTTTSTPTPAGTGTQTPTAPTATGQYLQIKTCPSANDANCNCPSGFTQIAIACKADELTGVCPPNTIYTTNCEKSVSVLYWNGTVIPRDLPAQNTFYSGCQGDGGSVFKSSPIIGGWLTLGNCPTDSGLANGVTNGCSTENLTCQPPS